MHYHWLSLTEENDTRLCSNDCIVETIFVGPVHISAIISMNGINSN